MEKSNEAVGCLREGNERHQSGREDHVDCRAHQAVESGLHNAQAERVKKEAALNAVQNGSVAAELNSPQAEELNRLQDRLNQAKSNMADKASIYGTNNKEYQKAANDVAELERQFEEARKNVNARVDSEYQRSR